MKLLLLAVAMKENMNIIDDIDEELTELEDMVDQLEQYTGSLGSCQWNGFRAIMCRRY